MSNVMGTMQMASNTNVQSMNLGMTAMRQEIATLRAKVQASKQVLASNVMWAPPPATPAPQWTPLMIPSPNIWPAQPAPPIAAAYMAIHSPETAGVLPGFPNFLGPPIVPQQRQPRGRRSRGVRGRGRQASGGRGWGNTRALVFAQHPPPRFGQQPSPAAAQSHHGNQVATSPHKYYNNWNVCISCGFDVSGWHSSQTCPTACQREHNNEGCDRTNYPQYQGTGYKVNMRKSGKTLLLANPAPHRA